MNIPETMVCPSCKNEVYPTKRKLPGSMDAKARVGSPIISFGHYCPVTDCGFRLDDAIAALQEELKAESLPEDESEEAPVAPVKPAPKKVVPIRPPAKETEDLFSRIPREHAEAVREENELKTRLVEVVARRETLDRLMAAMSMPQPIAAE